MPAAYDSYDYPGYWQGREYEHESDVLAIKSFLESIPKINTALEVGAGFGRLVPSFSYRAKKVILTDPSAKLLKLARKNYSAKNVQFLQISVENLLKKVRRNTADLALCVRVLHHIEDVDEAFKICNEILKKGGYFIIEFPNKCHFKARVREFLHGNFTFPIDIFPKDLRRKRDKSKTIPFYNYHPDIIAKKLEESGFEIIERRSVSNIRSPFLKRFFPVSFFLSIEKFLQRPLSYIDFGPSIFILSKKKD